jgi:hypothetical protein
VSVRVVEEAGMANRYRVARAMGQSKYEEVLREDAELLHGFGLKLLAVQGGVRAAVEDEIKGDRINPWNVVTIDEKTWDWLHPLLRRLRTAEARAALAVVPTVVHTAAEEEEKVALRAK